MWWAWGVVKSVCESVVCVKNTGGLAGGGRGGRRPNAGSQGGKVLVTPTTPKNTTSTFPEVSEGEHYVAICLGSIGAVCVKQRTLGGRGSNLVPPSRRGGRNPSGGPLEVGKKRPSVGKAPPPHTTLFRECCRPTATPCMEDQHTFRNLAGGRASPVFFRERGPTRPPIATRPPLCRWTLVATPQTTLSKHNTPCHQVSKENSKE